MIRSSTLLAGAIFVSLSILRGASADTFCGPPNNNNICPASAPCCSEYWVCGTDAEHCAIACQSDYSANSKLEETASCYSQRPSIGQKCVSGLYLFDKDTWVINSDAYNGNYHTADWIADSAGLNNGNIRFGQYGGVRLAITKNKQNASAQGLGSRLSSTSYMLYGSFRARVKTSGIKGVVTAFISYSDQRDEIDWEITGQDNNKVQTNFFYRGVVDYTKSSGFDAGYDTSQSYTDLQVDWTKDSITWSVNGNAVRTANRADTCDANGNCSFPSTPSRIQLAIWDGSAGSAGTRDWAGGYVPWDQTTQDEGFSIIFQSVMIRCDGDAEPTGPPARLSGYSAPSLLEPKIDPVVMGLSGYDQAEMSRNQSVYAPGTTASSAKSG
ncbi:concanavalin A-like lectin/glucanase domain-containing protein [Zopfochytrium polystomum]|nr:concanavalin A-like lectin/glucanase domain-containing protein [Zopfochytrium polystomum]